MGALAGLASREGTDRYGGGVPAATELTDPDGPQQRTAVFGWQPDVADDDARQRLFIGRQRFGSRGDAGHARTVVRKDRLERFAAEAVVLDQEHVQTAQVLSLGLIHRPRRHGVALGDALAMIGALRPERLAGVAEVLMRERATVAAHRRPRRCRALTLRPSACGGLAAAMIGSDANIDFDSAESVKRQAGSPRLRQARSCR